MTKGLDAGPLSLWTGEGFRRRNASGWRKNAAFWCAGSMRHLKDVVSLLRTALFKESRRVRARTLVDVGCGEGWLARLLEELHWKGQYVGFDYTPQFIEALNERHRAQRKELGWRFEILDIEKPLPTKWRNSADIVVNAFSLFEVPDLSLAMRNHAQLVRRPGSVLLLTIDPLSQILSIACEGREQRKLLRLYEKCSGNVAYSKIIDATQSPHDRRYLGILYSALRYISEAQSAGLRLVSCEELIRTARPRPQVYQLLTFRRG